MSTNQFKRLSDQLLPRHVAERKQRERAEAASHTNGDIMPPLKKKITPKAKAGVGTGTGMAARMKARAAQTKLAAQQAPAYDTEEDIDDDIQDLKKLISKHSVRTFGALKVKKLIKASGLTQAEFAKALNVSAVTLFHWSKGEKEPRGSSLTLLNLVDKKGIRAVLC